MRTRPFHIDELYEIYYWIRDGYCTSILFEYDFNCNQMVMIQRGLAEGLDVSRYAKPEISWEKMYDTYRILLKEKQNESRNS